MTLDTDMEVFCNRFDKRLDKFESDVMSRFDRIIERLNIMEKSINDLIEIVKDQNERIGRIEEKIRKINDQVISLRDDIIVSEACNFLNLYTVKTVLDGMGVKYANTFKYIVDVKEIGN